jgi:diketogulonate reductase-like aldo/keto reductase
MFQVIRNSIQYLYKGKATSLDVALLHTPHCWEGHCTPQQKNYPWQSAWRNLEAAHKEGLVSVIGVSQFSAWELEELLRIAEVRVSVVQNWMDPFHQDVEVGTFIL